MNSSKLIYIVEDEFDVAKLLETNLKKEKYNVKIFGTGSEILTEISKGKEKPLLILLDIMLPDIDGFEICKFLKRDELYSKVPIIMLTAKTEETSKVVGLELGADDYITKPFSINELKARIKAVLRRYLRERNVENDSIRIVGEYKIDFKKFEVTKNGERISLTPVEFKILDLLSQKIGWVYTREQIINYLWDHEKYPTERTIDVHINSLRKKLKDISSKIINVRGIGYKLEE